MHWQCDMPCARNRAWQKSVIVFFALDKKEEEMEQIFFEYHAKVLFSVTDIKTWLRRS